MCVLTQVNAAGRWQRAGARPALVGTELENKSFTEVQRGDLTTLDPQPPWMRCYVDDKRVFNGAGDPTTLIEILNIFLTWLDE